MRLPILPGADQRIIHPEFGDITADVIEALQEMARPAEPVIIEREQAEIAAAAGTVSQDLCFGHHVAQIHEDVFDYWTKREGLGFWKDKANLRRFLADNPSCKVTSKGRGVKIAAGAKVRRFVLSAGSVVSAGTRCRPGKGRFATA